MRAMSSVSSPSGRRYSARRTRAARRCPASPASSTGVSTIPATTSGTWLETRVGVHPRRAFMSQRYSVVLVLLAALAVSRSAQADTAAHLGAPAAAFDGKALTETGMRELIDAAAWLRQHPGG